MTEHVHTRAGARRTRSGKNAGQINASFGCRQLAVFRSMCVNVLQSERFTQVGVKGVCVITWYSREVLGMWKSPSINDIHSLGQLFLLVQAYW